MELFKKQKNKRTLDSLDCSIIQDAEEIRQQSIEAELKRREEELERISVAIQNAIKKDATNCKVKIRDRSADAFMRIFEDKGYEVDYDESTKQLYISWAPRVKKAPTQQKNTVQQPVSPVRPATKPVSKSVASEVKTETTSAKRKSKAQKEASAAEDSSPATKTVPQSLPKASERRIPFMRNPEADNEEKVTTSSEDDDIAEVIDESVNDDDDSDISDDEQDTSEVSGLPF